MANQKFILLGARTLQVLCAAVVLGLSIDLYTKVDKVQDACNALKERHGFNCGAFNGILASLGFCAFIGAWGLLDAVLGTAAAFITSLPWIVMPVVDGLASVFYLAGGIVSLHAPRRHCWT